FTKMKFKEEKKEVSKNRLSKKELEFKFETGKKFIQQNKADSAIKIFRELVEHYPTCAEYRSYLGLALLEKGWDGYAQAEFKVALYYQPNDPIALRYHTGNTVNREKIAENEKAHNNERFTEKIKKISSWFKLRTQSQ